ncbi:hypothetical protein [Streptomyces sp. NPDC002553]
MSPLSRTPRTVLGVLADTTRGPAGRAARVLELFVRTDDVGEH